MVTTSEQQLLERARKLDGQALAEIYDLYAAPIYGYLYRTLGDAAQAEDLTGELFLRLLEALRTGRGPDDRLKGWLYRVAHNLAMDTFRRQKKAPAVALTEELLAEDGQPLDTVEARQEKQQLRASIQRLTTDQQQVIMLRFADELSVTEVAQLMGKSEGAIKTMQHRAVSRLRQFLEASKK
jgi:RNA polymerase sigma-70 factor (ECF subfamily)